MKHLLIILSFLLLSSPVIGQSLNGIFETKMVEMLSFLSKNCGKIDGIHPNHDPCNYNFKIRLPKVEIKSAEYIESVRKGAYALYKRDTETIYLPKTWRKNKNIDLGVLMHELYHHVQHINREEDQCYSDRETPAHKVKTTYLKIELDTFYFGTSEEHLENDWMGQGVKCINETLYKWYNGEYKEGKFHGQGTFNYPSGKIYKGKWKDGKKQGKGTLTFTNGKKYVGNWKDNKKNGQGTETLSNGDKYEGNWKDEKINGKGTYTNPNGDKYVGEFKDGKRHGQGTYSYPDGGKYVGGFKGGYRNGQGTYSYPGGGKYVGEWDNDEKNGQGTFSWANGERYVGKWKNGRMD